MTFTLDDRYRRSSLGDNDSKIYGVAVGIVTNNKDPQKLGRVKVRFPGCPVRTRASGP